MKRIFVMVTCSLVIFSSCKDKPVDPVRPSEGRLKKIEVINYESEDTVSIDVVYQSDGRVSRVSMYNGLSPDDSQLSTFSEGRLVEYNADQIKRIFINGTINIPSSATISYTSTEDFEFFPDNSVKSYSYTNSQGGFITENNTDIDFQQDAEGNLMYMVITNHLLGGPVVDTFSYSENPAEDAVYFVEADSLPDDQQYPCDHYNMTYRFKQNSGFEYSYSSRCIKTAAITGNYSSLKNNLSKPVWDALLRMVPDLEPIYGNMSIPFYRSRLVPEYFITSIKKGATTEVTSYEYLTDDTGKLYSIKESRTGAGVTKLVRFYYETN